MTDLADILARVKRGSELAAWVKARTYQAAREDPLAFAARCFKDRLGRPWVNVSHQARYQQHVTQHRRGVIRAPVEHSKTEQIAICRVLWELGRNPNLCCAIVCNTQGQAAKILKAIRGHIESNEDLHRVFPDLKPGETWTDSAITVANRQSGIKDYSVQAIGLHGAILGARLDLVIMDDVSDYENTRTLNARDDAVNWIRSTLLGRLVETGRAVCIGTSWHTQDILHTFSADGWATIVDRAIDPSALGEALVLTDTHDAESAARAIREGRLSPEVVARLSESILWPAVWSLPRLLDKLHELKSFEFGRQLLNVVHDDATARFKREWITRALRRGTAGIVDRLSQQDTPDGARIVVGVDLAVSERPDAHRTAFDIVLVAKDKHRTLLDIESGHWQAPEILSRMVAIAHRYNDPIFRVENVAAQDFLLQLARVLLPVTVVPHTTGGGKASLHYAAEKLAVELESDMWTFPGRGDDPASPAVARLTDGLLDYSPDKHVCDEVAALLFAREQAQRGSGFAMTSGPSILAR